MCRCQISSDLRQEFTGMLRHTCIFCWSEGLNGFVISIFLGSAEQTITEDAGFGLLTELAANYLIIQILKTS